MNEESNTHCLGKSNQLNENLVIGSLHIYYSENNGVLINGFSFLYNVVGKIISFDLSERERVKQRKTVRQSSNTKGPFEVYNHEFIEEPTSPTVYCMSLATRNEFCDLCLNSYSKNLRYFYYPT